LHKKLSKAERLVQEQMLAMIEWASDRPDKWHPIGKLEATQKVSTGADCVYARAAVSLRAAQIQAYFFAASTVNNRP
jgi:hypothetical protein